MSVKANTGDDPLTTADRPCLIDSLMRATSSEDTTLLTGDSSTVHDLTVPSWS